jgi:nucleoside-diphosphate-sugar epimerase
METDDKRRVCAVTGANGYVGSRIARALSTAGWTPVSLGRHGAQVAYSLEGGPERGALRQRGARALVHVAYDFSERTWSRIQAVNVDGTRRLFETARAEGVERIVYISSTAAFDGCRSMYGRAKLEAEAVAQSVGAYVVRPGLVCGSEPGGMVGTLLKLLRRSPVVPLIGSGRTPMHTVHEDDLCRLVVHLVEGSLPDPAALVGRAITAANESPIAFREMLQLFADQEGRRVTWAPLPWQLVWLGVKTLEVAHVPSGLRSDSVVSFVNANPHPDFTYTRRTGLSFRPFSVAAQA